MANASKAKQINLTLSNKVGTLAKVSSIFSGAKVNIKAICARGDSRRAYISIRADSHAKAKNALIKADYTVTEDDVILVEMSNRPGQMQKVAERLADSDVNIKFNYGSAGSGRTSFCVFKTDNDRKAMRLIKGK